MGQCMPSTVQQAEGVRNGGFLSGTQLQTHADGQPWMQPAWAFPMANRLMLKLLYTLKPARIPAILLAF